MVPRGRATERAPPGRLSEPRSRLGACRGASIEPRSLWEAFRVVRRALSIDLGAIPTDLGENLVHHRSILGCLRGRFWCFCCVFSFEWVDSLAEEPIVKLLAASDEF